MVNPFDKDVIEGCFSEMPHYFGEAILYRKPGYPDREIQAIVDREPAEVFAAGGNVVAYSIRVRVANDATTGIASTELNEGIDQLVLSRRIGLPATEVSIDKVLSSDAGVVEMAVR